MLISSILGERDTGVLLLVPSRYSGVKEGYLYLLSSHVVGDMNVASGRW